jgi:aspartyl-tRNA synthetase
MIGAAVHLCGWVAQIRRMGTRLGFILLRDISGSVQLVVSPQDSLDLDTYLDPGIGLESVIRVEGHVRRRLNEHVNKVRFFEFHLFSMVFLFNL